LGRGEKEKAMKSILTAITLAAFTFVAAPFVQAKEPAKAAEAKAAPKVFSSPQKEGTKATCPVMGEEFVIAKDTVHVEHKGKHVYFCCPGCKGKFEKDPDKYLK
jgi:YHS domain-containing protein